MFLNRWILDVYYGHFIYFILFYRESAPSVQNPHPLSSGHAENATLQDQSPGSAQQQNAEVVSGGAAQPLRGGLALRYQLTWICVDACIHICISGFVFVFFTGFVKIYAFRKVHTLRQSWLSTSIEYVHSRICIDIYIYIYVIGFVHVYIDTWICPFRICVYIYGQFQQKWYFEVNMWIK